jgi:phosphoglycolate phosphatase-like HAD superfamily hydrolase
VLGDRFATAVVDAVVASPEVPGAGALLEALQERGRRCYVASGTPEEELIEIVARRKLTPFFHTVRGSPAEKADILRELSTLHGHDLGHCIMLGDALSDYKAANAVGMPFMGVVQRGACSPFPPETAVVADFWALSEAIR